ncbi:MAG: alpha/beta hydrolase [Oleiphilus sp.]|nr:MAG: alpha/beta hydrolase [Oleiphilus sp.]
MTNLTRLFRLLMFGLLLASLSACNSLSGFLFYPDKQIYRLPSDLGIDYDIVELSTSDDQVLHNWLLKPKGEIRQIVLFLHGNGENISTHMGSVAWLTQFETAVFLLEYQGYGESTGHSTLASALEDVSRAHRWLDTHHHDKRLILFGQSLGGALAIYYAAHADPALKPFAALIAESAPASWPQIAREVMSRFWLTWPLQAPASLMTGQYDAEDAIQKLENTPLMLIHSTEDPVVPFHHLEQLKENAPPHALILETTGRHIAALGLKENRDRLLSFIQGQ